MLTEQATKAALAENVVHAQADYSDPAVRLKFACLADMLWQLTYVAGRAGASSAPRQRQECKRLLRRPVSFYPWELLT